MQPREAPLRRRLRDGLQREQRRVLLAPALETKRPQAARPVVLNTARKKKFRLRHASASNFFTENISFALL